MASKSVHLRLTELFREVFDDEGIVISEQMTANDIEKWDSISHIDMICLVEEEFGIRFTTKEIVKLRNVGDLMTMIENKINSYAFNTSI